MRRTIILLLWACLAWQLSAASFSTRRLQAMAQHIGLTELDTLTTGVHTTFLYKEQPVVVRVNDFGEVEHIGLHLFSDEIRELQPSVVYDFLERYLLDRLSAPQGSEQAIRLGWDRVTFVKGSPQTALRFDGTETFSKDSREMRYYHVAWSKNGSVVLEMAFDMDWQLLTGCDAIEQELNYVRDLPRVSVRPEPDFVLGEEATGREYVLSGRSFIIDAVRNDLYFTRRFTGEDSPWRLLVDTLSPAHSVSNMMLSRQACGDLGLRVIIDRYGYTSDTLSVKYAQLLQKNLDEGCEVYYGFKYKKDQRYHGTVFFVNKAGGYVTMLSVAIPMEAIHNPDQSEVRGRLWTYIPMHNVSDNYFKPTDYKKIKK